MNPQIQLNLALILFLPWFSILAVLFWLVPRQPRNLARTVFDALALAFAAGAAWGATHWGMATADPAAGPIWKQVLATSVAYGVFLGVMAVAMLVRRRWLARRASGMDSAR